REKERDDAQPAPLAAKPKSKDSYGLPWRRGRSSLTWKGGPRRHDSCMREGPSGRSTEKEEGAHKRGRDDKADPVHRVKKMGVKPILSKGSPGHVHLIGSSWAKGLRCKKCKSLKKGSKPLVCHGAIVDEALQQDKLSSDGDNIAQGILFFDGVEGPSEWVWVDDVDSF
ncbi:hypothetical protein L7F22_054115, partial [Adiantum nelumboides]|nr:hypothetical protein [Adiantum nelumboides]